MNTGAENHCLPYTDLNGRPQVMGIEAGTGRILYDTADHLRCDDDAGTMLTGLCAPVVNVAPVGNAYRYTLSMDSDPMQVLKARSTRVYTFASIYRRNGVATAWLHAREDLAVKGSPDARRAGWTYIGYVPVVAA